MNLFTKIVLGFVFPLSVFAHGPTPQKADESIAIQAPVEKVWAIIKQFDGLDKWHPDVKNSTGEGKNESGSVRTITLNNDEQFSEELDFYSEQDHLYKYRLKKDNTVALPISSHTTSIQIKQGENANTSVVSIKSRFYRGDTGNTPSNALNDDAAVKAMTTFFKNELSGLQQKVAH
ncbi:MAG: SRPBCC family protein [Methylococcales bacterium]|jgi:mxaD protein|nr:SRPBCC family protein [Methylococcales bacterium]